MSDTQTVALVIGFFTFLGGIFGTYRLMRSDKLSSASAQAAALLAGYNAIVTDLQNEVARVRKSCQEQIEELKEEFESERRAWFAERQELRAEYRLEKQILREEVETLKAQVYALMQTANRTRSTRSRKTDLNKEE